MALTRRSWMQLTGSGLLGSGSLSAAFEQFFGPARHALDGKVLTTACGICSSSCGVRATVQDGIIRFLEGLPGDYAGSGQLCAKGAAGAAFVYDPDRLKYPMKRTNPRKGLDEDPGWIRISWTEALDTIAARFDDNLRQFGPESLLFITRNSPDVWTRFMRAIGVVNRVDHIDICYQTDSVVLKYAWGGKMWGHDFDNSRYILSFGFDLLSKAKLVYSQPLVRAKEKGAKIVSFNPAYNPMARFSDEWYPIRPGSDLAVALAIIQVLLAENLYDRDFVERYTNFSEHESRIRSHFEPYTPEWAAALSDVPAGDIRRIAREFGATRPAIVPSHKKSLCANYMNATQLTHAIAILNILAGTVDRPGGRYWARSVSIPSADAVYPPPSYPKPAGRRVDGRDKLPLADEADFGVFATLADGMLNKHPGLIKAAFINSYTPGAFPNPPHIVEALKTVDFTVVYDLLPTDSSLLADIVLPGTSYLEGSDLVGRSYGSITPQVVARQPVIPAMFEARGMAWVAIELGKRLTPDYFRTPEGAWIASGTLLNEKTKRAGLGASFAEFAQTGIYTKEQAFVPRERFATATGKCQILIPEFETRGYDPLPVWKPKAEEPDAQYPYYFLTFIPAVHRRNGSQNNRILHEMMPVNHAILNTALAVRLGVREGQMVRVVSRVGAIELPAHVTEEVRPDCVMVAHGFGHRSRDLSLAAGRGARDADLVPDRSIDELVTGGNFGASGCIMDAVVNVEPL
jgi:thiosulfate reductase / polysulfide reductase chain A